jgi:ElaB/YqjD/DUF883 family membrane-anchored ribosome-binding protein
MESRIETTPANEVRAPALEKLLTEVKGLLQRAQDQTVEKAKAADRIVRDHPYETVGIAFGLGVLLGVLLRRK